MGYRRTQKAKGIAHLDKLGVCDTWSFPTHQYIGSENDIAYAWIIASTWRRPIFGRPCPVTPRHGFVDSREVHSEQALRELWAETTEADPLGEIILMPRASASWSGVLTPAGWTVGRGNDGVTGGTSGWHIPMSASVDHFRLFAIGCPSLVEECGVHNFPYIEIVENDNQPCVVQLRDGPEQLLVGDIAPDEVLVYQPLRVRPNTVANIGLLDWEKQMIEAEAYNADHPAKFVVEAFGVPLSSHIVVQAIAHHVPVYTTTKIEPDTVVRVSNKFEPPTFTREDFEAIARVMIGTWQAGLHSSGDVAQAAVAILHAQSVWGREPHLLALRGFGIAALLSYMSTACLGEVRHYFSCGPGLGGRPDMDRPYHPGHCGRKRCRDCDRALRRYRDKKHAYRAEKHWLSKIAPSPVSDWLTAGASNRDCIYSDTLLLDPSVITSRLAQAVEDFAGDGWKRGYGGENWANVAQATFRAWRVAQVFVRRPNERRWNELLKLYNELVNICHNNGRVLTKWIGNTTLDKLALAPVLGLVQSEICETIINDTWPRYWGSFRDVRLVNRGVKIGKI